MGNCQLLTTSCLDRNSIRSVYLHVLKYCIALEILAELLSLKIWNHSITFRLFVILNKEV
jgi:hypothetical protein